jgi:hypothetical protein
MTKGWHGNSTGHSIAARKRRLKLLKGFVKEEKETAKLYKKLGYPTQGKQEAEHAKFFKKVLVAQMPFKTATYKTRTNPKLVWIQRGL